MKLTYGRALLLSAMIIFATLAFPQSSTFTVTYNFANDAQREAVLVDYAKSLNLPIYEADGVTVDSAKVGPAIRQYEKRVMKERVLVFRAGLAAAANRATEDAGLNP